MRAITRSRGATAEPVDYAAHQIQLAACWDSRGLDPELGWS
jgi:hypothetical protein